jgi:hypothetical protein
MTWIFYLIESKLEKIKKLIFLLIESQSIKCQGMKLKRRRRKFEYKKDLKKINSN